MCTKYFKNNLDVCVTFPINMLQNILKFLKFQIILLFWPSILCLGPSSIVIVLASPSYDIFLSERSVLSVTFIICILHIYQVEKKKFL